MKRQGRECKNALLGYAFSTNCKIVDHRSDQVLFFWTFFGRIATIIAYMASLIKIVIV